MKSFQKKTSDLLKQQKASYPAMVKSALKGKTGLTSAQVKKTIKGVAKDYREQYGATRRERYLNAVKQVASTMPKATKAAKPKAKALAKPKTTTESQQNAQALEYLRKQQEATERRIKARSERIRQRTEAAFANHKAEQAKKEKPIMGVGLKIPFYALHNSYLDKPLYKQYNAIVYLNDRRLSTGKTMSKYEYRKKKGGLTSCWFDEIDLKLNYTILTTTEVQQRRSAWNDYCVKSKREQEAQREADRQAKIAADKKAKEEAKAKYLTTNETFIKQFATDLGLSTATIKAMYKVAADYRKEGELRPVMCGLYCDPDGYLVATDAHILVAIKCKMPVKYKGKIYLKSGMVENSKYPNWQMIMPIRSGVPNADYTHTDKYSASLLTVKGKIPADDYTKKDREYTTIKDAEGNKIGLMIELINVLDRLFKTLKANDIKIYTKSPSHSVLFAGKHFAAIQMPILLSK